MNQEEISVNKPIMKKSLNTFDFLYKYGTIITIILLIVIFSLSEKNFLKINNMIDILRSISVVTVIAIGMTISLSVGGFDLSVGSVASVTDAVVLSMFVWYCQGTFVSVLTALVIAIFIGFINAILIIKFKVNDMLMTLATMFIFQGAALTYTRSATISQNMVMPNGSFAEGQITNTFISFGKIPGIIIIMLIIVLIIHILLTKTKHGRYMYIIGGNMEAARLSGIPINKYRILAYVLSALCAGIGGILLAARVQTAEINAGAAYLMDAVAASYIGFSVGGSGKPNAIGTFVGAALLGILENGLVMMSVPYYSMDIIKGLVLAFALALTYYKKK